MFTIHRLLTIGLVVAIMAAATPSRAELKAEDAIETAASFILYNQYCEKVSSEVAEALNTMVEAFGNDRIASKAAIVRKKYPDVDKMCKFIHKKYIGD